MKDLPDMYREFVRQAADNPDYSVRDIPTYDQWCQEHAAEKMRGLALALKIKPLDLDELVHDCKAYEAAAINNGGLESQLGFLLTVYSFDELAVQLKKLQGKSDRIVS